VELQASHPGIGELRLVYPCLDRLANADTSAAQNGQNPPLQAWVNPPARLSPYPLHAERIARSVILHTHNQNEQLWVSEHLLKSGCCRALVCWSPSLSTATAKRLQLAAKEGKCLAFIIRYGDHDAHSLPLSARLRLKPVAQGLEVEIIKRQQSWPTPPFVLDLQSAWPQLFYPAATAPVQATAPDNIIAFPGVQAEPTR
ncbi:MAG: hypothetical protein R3183_00675, partial [Oleiphilaceae bacterium]|nr:hypothetical protein [Oleiphilaceae bacterium]